MPHHLTQYLHQASSSAAPRAVDSSPELVQGLPATALGAEASMPSESAVKDIGSEQGLEGAESDAAGTSLRPAASAVDQPSQNSLMAFQGEHAALHWLLCLKNKQWIYMGHTKASQETCKLVAGHLASCERAAEHSRDRKEQQGGHRLSVNAYVKMCTSTSTCQPTHKQTIACLTACL